MIQGAASGDQSQRARFAQRYGPVVDAYLSARWRLSPLRADLGDASQDVMLECLKDGGALERADPGRRAGFRGFLRGVVRNVAARCEERVRRRGSQPLHSSDAEHLPGLQEEDLDRVFDRAWAGSIMEQAADRLDELARDGSPAFRRRAELLRLRFRDGVPLRDVAVRWDLQPARIHKDYARAREEFREALREVIAWHLPDAADGIDEECRNLLALLQ